MLKFLPGLLGAIAAYLTLIFINWIETSWVHALIFFGVYLFVSVSVDKALSQYGKKAGG